MKHLMLVVALVLALGIAVRAQADIVTTLGSSVEEAHDAIFSAFSTGSISMVGVSDVFKTAGAPARAAMVTAVVAVARAYTGTADFARRWAAYREEQKPEPPSAAIASASALEAEQRKGLEQAIAGMEKLVTQMPQMKKDIEPQIAELRKQLAQLGRDQAATAQMDRMLKQGAQMQAADYQQRVAEWEKQYPVDARPFIAARLREFLAKSATVDYTARVSKAKDGLLKFDNPEYERRDHEWKYMYRAGKPAVDAARALAQEWLKALGG
jgi:hypothetical protein